MRTLRFVLAESYFPDFRSERNRSRACVPRLAGDGLCPSPRQRPACAEGCKSFAAKRQRARAAGARVSAFGGNLLQPGPESCTNSPRGANTRIARVWRLRRPEGRRARAADFPPPQTVKSPLSLPRSIQLRVPINKNLFVNRRLPNFKPNFIDNRRKQC